MNPNDYKIDYECTYHGSDVFLETDEITEKEKLFIRNCIYRQDILNVFDLEDFDEKKIAKTISEIYEKMKLLEDLDYVLKTLGSAYSISKENAFDILFSFDFFYSTHLCLRDYFKTGMISNENKIELYVLMYEFCGKS